MPTLDLDAMAQVRDLPRRSKQRRAFLARHLRATVHRSLEIGALNVPTLTRSDCDARFVDWFSAEELRTRHKSSDRVPPASIVDVDYVVADVAFEEHINERFDLIIANHVIEHIPDPVSWFMRLASLCTDGGRLFLAVPDRRYTFDYFRPTTDAVDLMQAHLDKLERPSREHIAKHLYYWTALTQEDAWAGNRPSSLAPRMSFAEAWERSQTLAESYTDVHCWVFTESTFAETLEALTASGMIPWQIEVMEPVQAGENEFRVLLRLV